MEMVGKRGKSSASVRNRLDKPHWAVDEWGREPKAGEPPNRQEDQVSVRDRLPADMQNRLGALKEAMQREDKDGNRANKSAGGMSARQKQTPVNTGEEEPESFAELLDPKDEEDLDFAELLTASKLDWRSFKD